MANKHVFYWFWFRKKKSPLLVMLLSTFKAFAVLLLNNVNPFLCNFTPFFFVQNKPKP